MKYMSPFSHNSLRTRDFFQDFDKMFDSFFTTTPNQWSEHSQFQPRVDIREANDHFLISADLPGVDKDDVKIEVKDRVLTLSGERHYEHKEEREGKLHRVERSYGKFQRSFHLPENIDEEQIKASYENGVLEVLIPRAADSKTKSINIESGKGGLFSKLKHLP